MAPKSQHSGFSKPSIKSGNRPTYSKGQHPINEEKQRESKETDSFLFQQFALTSPDEVFIFEVEGKRTRPLHSGLMKLSEKSKLYPLIKENKLLKSVFAEDRYVFLESTEKYFRNEEVEQIEEIDIRVILPEEEIEFFRIRFTPHLLNEDNKVIEWFCLARNITSEKESLKATQDSQLKLQMALDGSGMGVWSFDPFTQKIDCDSRTCRILGFSVDELNEDVAGILQRIHPEDRNLVTETAFKTIRRKGRFNHDFRVLLPDSGIIRHIGVVGELIPDPTTRIMKVTGVCMDISQNKVAENKIKTSETFLEESQKIAKIGCFDWDISLDKVHITKQLYEILDIPAEDSFSLDYFYSRVYHKDLKTVKSVINNAVSKGKKFNKEFRFSGSDGKMKVLWAHGQPYRIENRTTRITGTIQDITEKKEKEKEYKTQNLIIRSILRSLPVIIEIVDKDGLIQSSLGSAGLSRIGMSENEMTGKSIFELAPSVSSYIKRALKGETVNFTREVEYNGKIFFLLSFFFYDAERESAIGFSIDITAQKNIEVAFQQVSAKNMELERMNKVMDMFVYAVAHDLKNPINNLDMLNNLMKESESPSEQKEYTEALGKSVKRLKQTIAGLTEIIEIEGSQTVQEKEILFEDVFEDVQADLQPLLSEKNGKIEVSFKEQKIIYNQAFLTSIIKNLISNSIKYSASSRPPEIKICTERMAGYIVLKVEDNGIGIDLQANNSNLFKPFKRFSMQAEGTGVGLHLIKSMVEKSGGSIEVESTVGKGTSFRCFLRPVN